MILKFPHCILSWFIILIILIGCKKEVQVGPPVTQVVTSNVFSNNATATAAALNIYAQMASLPSYIHKYTGLSSDELTNFATDPTSRDFYRNGLVSTDGVSLGSIWTPSYPYIFLENAVLENLQNSTGVSESVRKQLTGEALYMRAYLYFYLVNLYGDVPLVTTTDYKISGTLPRTSPSEIYRQIISDLTKAQNLLSTNYVDASDTITTFDRVRPTSSAADALLARTYLYKGVYDSAELKASAVIANPIFNLVTDLSLVFKKNSAEAIWEILPPSKQFWTPDGTTFILSAAPNNCALSPMVYNAFEAGDQRKTSWVGTFTSGPTSWNYPFKYKDRNTATVVSEYTMMLRLAEQYLIRAEARAMLGNTAGSLADLNAIRNRAGLTNYSGATDQVSLLAAIAHERQVELFAEGDRWINLKRTKTIDAVMGGSTGVTAVKGGTWNSYQQLYPLPTPDLQANSNLRQNLGY